MTPRKKAAAAPKPVKITDPRAIRALAHPARMAVIEELYQGHELTATECAEIAGLSPSAMSYHLRSLEKAGIVVRADSTGDGRERPWRAAGQYLQVDAGQGPGAAAASQALSATMMGRTLEQYERWMKRRNREPKEWVETGGGSYGQVWLLPDEAEEVQQDMIKLMDKYRERRNVDKRPKGARRVRVSLLLFPIDEPERTTKR